MQKKTWYSYAVALALVLSLGGCGEQEAPTAPLFEVVVDVAAKRPYRPRTVYVGRLEAEHDVQIQAKVTGYLLSMDFIEGDIVEAGDLLFELDPAQMQAEVARARAELARANASMEVAEINYQRGQKLLPSGAISAYEMDKLTADRLTTVADHESAQASLKAAQVNLGYTRISAPLAGRVGKSKQSVGDLVGPESGTLTTLVSIDPIKAIFQVAETDFLRTMEEGRRIRKEGEEMPEVIAQIETSDGVVYPHQGYIDYLSNRIDETTGTIEARVSIPNPDGDLRPGQYVRVILQVSLEEQAVTVPQMAVQSDQQGTFVLLVGPDNKVSRRNITTGQRLDDVVIVTEGVSEGQWVIVRGLQKVRSGQVVKVRHLSAVPPGQLEG